MTSVLLETALGYAKRGWAVFPLHSSINGVCSCGKRECLNPAKHPRIEGGFKAATTDPDTITKWWTTWPDANTGVATGAISGIVVVDTDLKHDGPQTWLELQDQHGPIDTLTTLTGGGGNHWIFRTPTDRTLRNTTGKLGKGIDTRGEGGYIVAPPSIHISGDRYEWDHQAEIAHMPDWVLSLWEESTFGNGHGLPAETVEAIPDGQRNDTLFRIGGSMRRQGLSKDAIVTGLLAIPCESPMSDDEVRQIANNICRYPAGVPAVPRHLEAKTTEPPRDWPAPLAEAAYYGLTGELVNTIAPHTEADPVSILITHLTYFGNAQGRAYHANADAARHGTNLNVVIVGETSNARKGSSREQVHRVYREVDSEWTESCIKGGMSSGEGLIWSVRDPIEKIEAIKDGGRYTGDYQTRIIDQGVGDKRLLAYEPEFAQVLRVMSRETNTLSTQVRQAFDTGTLRTMTKNNPAQATDAHISVLGHITKEELLRELNELEAANGFANRFLWVCVNRAQYLPDGGGVAATDHLVLPLRAALEQARSERLLTRDARAKAAWHATYEELSGPRPGLFGAITARAEAQVLRLSVIYAALDRAKAIGLPHLEAALAVWEYCEASAEYIFGDATGDPIADRILESLRAVGPLNRTGISALFQRNVSANRLSQALDLLARLRKARQHMEPTETRPLEVWTAIDRRSNFV